MFAPAQPDWYMGWLEGLLRLWPAWEFELFGVTIASAFVPSVVVPGVMFAVVFAWPWIERRFITHDYEEHHLLERPRDVPVRTAVGVAGLALLIVIFVAGSNDVIAADTATGLQTITNVLRVAVFVVPAVAGWATYRIAVALRDRERSVARGGPEPGTRAAKASRAARLVPAASSP